MNIDKIKDRYDPENDTRPDGPPVTWAEWGLADEVTDILTDLDQLKAKVDRMDSRVGLLRSDIGDDLKAVAEDVHEVKVHSGAVADNSLKRFQTLEEDVARLMADDDSVVPRLEALEGGVKDLAPVVHDVPERLAKLEDQLATLIGWTVGDEAHLKATMADRLEALEAALTDGRVKALTVTVPDRLTALAQKVESQEAVIARLSQRLDTAVPHSEVIHLADRQLLLDARLNQLASRVDSLTQLTGNESRHKSARLEGLTTMVTKMKAQVEGSMDDIDSLGAMLMVGSEGGLKGHLEAQIQKAITFMGKDVDTAVTHVEDIIHQAQEDGAQPMTRILEALAQLDLAKNEDSHQKKASHYAEGHIMAQTAVAEAIISLAHKLGDSLTEMADHQEATAISLEKLVSDSDVTLHVMSVP